MYPIPNKTNFVNDLNDVEFNPFKNESINLVTTSGQTINDLDDYQLSKAAAAYAAQSTYYTDVGTANTYVLNPLGTFESPAAYAEGMHVRFYVANSNTGASTINVNSLGVKNIKTITGDNISADDLIAGEYIDLIYDGTNFVIYYTTSGSSALGSSRKNLLINSQFEFWQRVNPTAATSVATAGYYCDRFFSYAGAGGSPAATITRELLTPGTVLPKNGGTPRYAYNHAQTAGATTDKPFISQRIEDVYTASSQSITISFWARLNSGTLTISPNINQAFNGAEPTVITSGTNIVLAVTPGFIKYTQKIVVPSIAGKVVSANSFLATFLSFSLNNTFNVDITLWQVEIGDRATAYEKRTKQQELDDCHRYYEKSYDIDTPPGTITAYCGIRAPATAGNTPVNIFYKTNKIKIPTYADYDPATGAPVGAVVTSLSTYSAVIDSSNLAQYHYTLESEL